MRRRTRFGCRAEPYRRKKLSGAQKHIAQDCKDDRDPNFARNFGAGREHDGMQNFGTENFGPESFGVKFFNAKSSNDPQSPSAALNSVAKALARSGILLRRVLAPREILRRKAAILRKALPPRSILARGEILAV